MSFKILLISKYYIFFNCDEYDSIRVRKYWDFEEEVWSLEKYWWKEKFRDWEVEI